MPGKVKGLRERLADNEFVLCAEGYLFEIERRGYLKAGSFVPEVVLENPAVLQQLHEEWVHAGSDVVQAFTYYGHREKLRHIDRENDVEQLNREALRLAREVADKTGTLMAGNICNTAVYDQDPTNPDNIKETKRIFKESIEWAVEGGADLIIAETFWSLGEAKLALECIQQYGKGLPSVINIAPLSIYHLIDNVEYADACAQLEKLGADVVGLNCSSGPLTMINYMEKVRAACKGPLACLPVPYRTDDTHPMMQTLYMPNGNRAFFPNLDYFYSPQEDITTFGKAMSAMDVKFLGICCGNSSRHFRALAESVGRTPGASRYTADMNMHYILGKDKKVKGGVAELVAAWTPDDVKCKN